VFFHWRILWVQSFLLFLQFLFASIFLLFSPFVYFFLFVFEGDARALRALDQPQPPVEAALAQLLQPGRDVGHRRAT